MNLIFRKLNFKDQLQLHIINAPASFKIDMDEMAYLTSIKTTLNGAKQVEFFLAFVTRQQEVDDLTKEVIPLIEGDGILWFVYPKQSSKRYKCEFNRDIGWAVLGRHGYEGVRAVAIDEDWSGLRFRKAENIKSMTRSFAMSDIGKKKVAAKKKTAKEKKA